ncbi:MAG: amino acid amidase [Proteobacteria bacterium]|nr:amino acid amidase [Pseudomonadota bacterium]
MKIFISADIEGIGGVSDWDETTLNGSGYENARHLMTQEVLAACQGAMEAGGTEIMIKDAHGSGRNINFSQLPECASLVRGWSGHPYKMLQEIDTTFDATLMIGYHSPAGADHNPLAHSFTRRIAQLRLNGELASEFLINALTSTLVDVPVVFVSGDKWICENVKDFNDNIETQCVSQGKGASSVCISPKQACKKIKDGVFKALKKDSSTCRVELPEFFEAEITFADPISAYKASFYPGMTTSGEQKVAFETRDYFELLRMLLFMI